MNGGCFAVAGDHGGFFNAGDLRTADFAVVTPAFIRRVE